MDRIKLLVCVHKQTPLPEGGVFLPIQVGKALSDVDLGIQGDDQGDNISTKNPNYCELTALYWAWKNLADVDYVGLVHYRRFFCIKKGIFDYKIEEPAKMYRYKLKAQQLISIMDGKDIILPMRRPFSTNLRDGYSINHNSTDIAILEEVISEIYPDCVSAYRHVMLRNNKLSPYNMFIARHEILEDYCKWLFVILGKVEERIDLSHYSPYQARLFGFLGERLLNVYVEYKRLRVKYLPVIFYSDNDKLNKWKYALRNIRVNLSYYISRSSIRSYK